MGSLENKKKYNGIELNNDFDLNIYDAFYRNLDVQIGRWWQVDPKTENQEHMSPYTSMGNDPVRYADFLGDEQEELAGPGPGVLVLGGELLGGATAAAGAGTLLVAASAVAPIAVVIYYPESLLSGGGSAAQMDFRVERQLRQNANAPTPIVTVKTSTGGGAATTGAKAAQTAVAKSKPQTGSYTNGHASGKRYHGKGGKARSQKSGKEKEKKNNDPHTSTDWTPAKDDAQAFKDEAERIKNDGGVENPQNYNKINSPGKKEDPPKN